MALLTYIGTTGATVTYSIDNADKTEHTAETGIGVTALKVGTNNTVYGVTVADPPDGGTVHWYEGGDYQASESVPDDVLTPLAVGPVEWGDGLALALGLVGHVLAFRRRLAQVVRW